jgi:hypothetical protein
MIKVKGKITKNYSLLFVNKIKASKKETENGNSIRVKKEELKHYLGVK